MHCRANIRCYPGSYALLTDREATDALVFVHGFAGDSTTTWLDFQSHIDSKRHSADFEKCDLFFYSYDSTANSVEQSAERLGQFIEDVVAKATAEVFRLWLPDGPDLSRVLRPQVIDALNRRYGRIILVAHSLGGVITRRLILNCVSGSRVWALSHQRLISSSPVLFAPAIKGFRHEISAKRVIFSSPMFSLAFALWVLTKGKVYPDVLQSSKTLEHLEKETEARFDRSSRQPQALLAFVYWGTDEDMVIPGCYLQDKEHKESRRGHVDICKPSDYFSKPIEWVADATK